MSVRQTLNTHPLPRGYDFSMGIVALCGRRPASITRLRNSPCETSVTVHFKSLLPVKIVSLTMVDDQIERFIRTQFVAMQRLFAEGNVAVLPGSTEDLSQDNDLASLKFFQVGTCRSDSKTADHEKLFARRHNVGDDELVVYIVSAIMGTRGNFLGCASHPNGQPGAVIVQSGPNWLTAHEVGHVLDLRHVCEYPTPENPDPSPMCVFGSSQSNQLMFPNVGWTHVPPLLSDDEYETMQDSEYAQDF